MVWTSLRSLRDRVSLKLTGGVRRPGEPPLVPGALPFLGHARAFGVDLGAHLQALQRDHGDVFTLLVAGRRMTFILDPHSYPALLRAQEDLSFAEIGDEITPRAFGVSKEVARRVSHDELDAFYVHLKGAELDRLRARTAERLTLAMARESAPDWRAHSLYAFVARAVFTASMEALFGDGAADGDVQAAFERYDRWFPLIVAGVPLRLLPGAWAARERLAEVLDGLGAGASRIIRERDALFSARMSRDQRNHLQIGLLWATQANTIPAAFWALAFILHDEAARAAVTEELRSCGPADLRRLVRLQSCVSEALRLSSGSLTLRQARRPTTLTLDSGETIAIREGDRVCLYPYVSHHDPELFPEPWRYRWNRFLGEDGGRRFVRGGRRVTLALMPYGGGVSMCPGRFLANDEVMQLVALALTRLEVELLSPDLPGLDQRRAGLGVLPPVSELKCRIRRAPAAS